MPAMHFRDIYYYTSFIRGSGDGPLACSRILLAQIGTSIYNLFGNYSFTISFPIVLNVNGSGGFIT